MLFNTGTLASWQFYSSNPTFESPIIFNADYLCFNWYFEQLLFHIPYYSPYINNPCPSFYRHAINDRRFSRNVNTRCFLSSFPFGPTYGQVSDSVLHE